MKKNNGLLRKTIGCDCFKNRMECDCDVIHNDLVENAKKMMLDDDTLFSVADFFKVMSDSTRVKILNLLELGELCVCDIAFILNMTKSAVSHQLKNLKTVNLIVGRKQGKEVWYSLADDHVKKVFDISLEHLKEGADDEKDC